MIKIGEVSYRECDIKKAYAFLPKNIHAQIKAVAALHHINIKDWFYEAIMEKLERENLQMNSFVG